jgi:ParB-like chromosome segregation protein Spo0J
MQKKARRKSKQFSHLDKLEVIYLPIDALVGNTWNPNRQSDWEFQLLTSSMRNDGFISPVIAIKEVDQAGKHVIVDGEHRWRAAQVLNYHEVPAVLVSMDVIQAKISTMRHNRARGTHDMGLEADLLRDLVELGGDDIASLLMVDTVELGKLLQEDAHEIVTNLADLYMPIELSKADKDLLTDTAVIDDAAEMAEKRRQREELVRKIRMAQEEGTSRAEELNTFVLHLTFGAGEAVIVRDFLGKEPAKTILNKCLEVAV